MVSILRRALIATAMLPALIGAACAQSAEDFFKKADHLTMYVGSGAGGGYDQHARLLARNLSRLLPGHPNFVVEYKPTAGGIEASNFLYNSAPRDGSVILAASTAALTLPIYDSPIAHYDPRKFEWIGSMGKQQAICVTSKTSGIRSLEDVTKRVVTVSATAVSGSPGVYPAVLNSLFGTKFKVIAGYSTDGMPLAVERGEVDGLCGYAWQAYLANGTHWFADKTVNIIAQMGVEKISALSDVPLASDLAKNADDKEVLDLIALPGEFGWPYVAPPGTPADRMAIYRQAFQAMLKDPQFLAEAESQRVAIEPLDDKQIESLLTSAYAAPKAAHNQAALFVAQVK
jgi:tripartite-type tricarboxylate transporter receptor subunit TctC